MKRSPQGYNLLVVTEGTEIIVRIAGLVRGRLVIRSRLLVGSRLMVRSRLVVWSRLFVGRVRRSVVRRHGVLPAVNVVLVVAGAEVLVEDGSISALKGVLLTVRVAEVVDLAACFGVRVVTVRVGNSPAVEPCVGLGHADGQLLHGLHFVGPLLQQHWTNRGRVRGLWVVRVGLVARRSVGRLGSVGVVGRLWCIGRGGAVGRFRRVGRLRGIARFKL